jgi:hypothetical protein
MNSGQFSGFGPEVSGQGSNDHICAVLISFIDGKSLYTFLGLFGEGG